MLLIGLYFEYQRFGTWYEYEYDNVVTRAPVVWAMAHFTQSHTSHLARRTSHLQDGVPREEALIKVQGKNTSLVEYLNSNLEMGGGIMQKFRDRAKDHYSKVSAIKELYKR